MIDCECEEIDFQFCNHDDGNGAGTCQLCPKTTGECEYMDLSLLGEQSCKTFCVDQPSNKPKHDRRYPSRKNSQELTVFVRFLCLRLEN